MQSEDCEFDWVAKGVSEMMMMSIKLVVIRMKVNVMMVMKDKEVTKKVV